MSDMTMTPPLPDEVVKASGNPANFLGWYVLLAEVGRGGMGTVHRAWDRKLRRMVAVKILRDDLPPGEAARFQREAQVSANLKHPNIAPVFDVGEANGRRYIVMQFIEGDPLHRIKWGKDWQGIVKAILAVCPAISYLHAREILHRDLKPSNLMRTPDGSIFVTDFGLARPLNVPGSELTATGFIPGTPAFMPREQIDGERREMGPWSDTYALGATIWSLLADRPPYEGDTPLKVIIKAATQPIRPIRDLRPDVPEALEEFLRRATAPNWKARYMSVAEFEKALKELLSASPPPPRRRGRLVVAAVGAAALVAGTLWLALRSHEKPRPEEKAIATKETPIVEPTKKEEPSHTEATKSDPPKDKGRTESVSPETSDPKVAPLKSPDEEPVKSKEEKAAPAPEEEKAKAYADAMAEAKRCADAKQWEAAKKAAERALAAKPGDLEAKDLFDSCDREIRFESALADAKRLSKEGKWEAAVAAADRALAIKPGHAEAGEIRKKSAVEACKALVGAAGAHRKKREWDDAKAAYERALALDAAYKPAKKGKSEVEEIRKKDPSCFRVGTTLKCGPKPVLWAAFSEKEELLAAGSADGSIRLWKMPSGEELLTIPGHNFEVKAIAFRPKVQVQMLASIEDKYLFVWKKGEKWHEVAQLEQGGAARSLAFTASGLFCFVSNEGQTVKAFRADTWAQTALFHNEGGEIQGIAVSPDDRALAVASADGKVRLWGLDCLMTENPQPKVFRTLERKDGTTAGGMVFSPDGKLLAVLTPEKKAPLDKDDPGVRLWEWQENDKLRCKVKLDVLPLAAAFSEDGAVLATSGGDAVLRFWSTATGLSVGKPLSTDQIKVNRLVLSPSGRDLASCGDNGTVQLCSAP